VNYESVLITKSRATMINSKTISKSIHNERETRIHNQEFEVFRMKPYYSPYWIIRTDEYSHFDLLSVNLIKMKRKQKWMINEKMRVNEKSLASVEFGPTINDSSSFALDHFANRLSCKYSKYYLDINSDSFYNLHITNHFDGLDVIRFDLLNL
jgi:hypothetical protein